MADHGQVLEVDGLRLKARLPGARRGDRAVVHRVNDSLEAEVIGVRADEVRLMAWGDTNGTAVGDVVTSQGRPLSLACSDALLGRVLDGLGRPLDRRPSVLAPPWPVRRLPPHPLDRAPIDTLLPTGLRTIDGLCSVGYGQRLALLAGSGCGKTSLLIRLVQHADVDIRVVALIGERGRELRNWLEQLSYSIRQRTVFVCATADTPAVVRMESAHVATSIGEYFRSRGRRVLLVVDSLTRFARAAREVAFATGETAVRGGYPASAFEQLPGLLERAGNDAHGSLTAFYSVLVEGEDFNDPVADEVRGLVDGQWVLRRELLERGLLPPLDPVSSLSRLMPQLVSPDHLAHSQRIRTWLAHHARKRELVEMGAYEPNSDPLLDEALLRLPKIEALLSQSEGERASLEETLTRLADVAGACRQRPCGETLAQRYSTFDDLKV